MASKKLCDGSLAVNHKETAGFFSLLTFTWLNDLLRRGNECLLQNEDLPPLLEEDQSQALTDKLERKWLQGFEESNSASFVLKSWWFWTTILRLIPLSEKLLVLSLASVHIILRLIQPLFLVGLLAELMVDNSASQHRWWIYFHASGVCMSAWLIAISKCHCDYRSSLIAMRIRSALLGLIYRKVQQLPLADLTMMTSGHVMNLISNDVQRFDQAVRYLPNIVLAPIGFSAGVAVLFSLIGWPVLVGTVFLCLILVYQIYGSNVATNLRQKAAVLVDKRVKIINEIIHGIRTIKMCSWEKHFVGSVSCVRRKEITLIRKISLFLASIKMIVMTTARTTSLLIFVPLLATGHALTSVTVFAVFAYAKVLRIFAKYLGKNFSPLVDCNMSVGRISAFLETVELRLRISSCNSKDQLCNISQSVDDSKSGGLKQMENSKGAADDAHLLYEEDLEHKMPSVSLKNVSCKCGVESDRLLLQGINVQTDAPQITIITGPVGSGKTSLLLAILGELALNEGNIVRHGKIAFVSQTPWVFSGTVRENILFNKPFDSKKFQNTIETCALKKDIEQFPDGIFTTIGERGVVLSGGQRARISMARALYSDADIYLLDDPLSSLDAQVANQIFHAYVRNALHDRLCFMVTHQPCYMPYADHIIVMKEGSIAWEGIEKDDEMVNVQGHTAELKEPLQAEGDWKSPADHGMATKEQSNKYKSAQELLSMVIPEEDRNFGSVSLSTYWKYFRAGLPVFMMIPLICIANGALVFAALPDWLMAQWNNVTWYSSSDRSKVLLYIGLILASTVLLWMSIFLFYQATISSAKNLHNKMLESVVKAPIQFFDTNPSGRITNRFSKDVGLMDEMLFALFYDLFQCVWGVFVSVGIPLLANFWVGLFVVPFAGLVSYYGRYCLNTSREVARLEAINRSPLYSHFAITLDGIVNIRTYQQQANFIEQFHRHQDALSQTWFVSISVVRWLHFRMDCISSLFLTAVTVIAVMTSQQAGLTGLAIIYSMDLLQNVDFAVRQSLEAENMMTSVQRVITYTNLDSEPGYSVQTKPPGDWPVAGRIEVVDLSLIYYSGGPRVLKSLNMSIKPAEKIGVAGRTGAGKSSIVASLMRMPESKGQILIDDHNIQELNLPSYRSRISVITQDPVLFSGPIRLNLDPGAEFEDVQIWSALEAVQLKPLIENQEGKLHYQLTEGGSNFSVGEKQLLCLARALLQRNKIVILDEATANVDFVTDRMIQETIRDKFHNCTVITIAHRVDTILDYDRVMVLEGGRVVEFDKPEVLLTDAAGKFAELCRLQHASI